MCVVILLLRVNYISIWIVFAVKRAKNNFIRMACNNDLACIFSSTKYDIGHIITPSTIRRPIVTLGHFRNHSENISHCFIIALRESSNSYDCSVTWQYVFFVWYIWSRSDYPSPCLRNIQVCYVKAEVAKVYFKFQNWVMINGTCALSMMRTK